MHAANLVLALKGLDPKLEFRGMGGNYSEEAGVSLAVDYADVALMGFVEVLLGFRKVLRYLSVIKKDLLAHRPDAVILVDYGGFNMKIAAFSKANGFAVHYYIPPKVWAWNQKRALSIKKNTDQVYSILPFEPAFFQKFGMNVHYVGNPLLDEINKFVPHDFFYQKNELSFLPIIALLPGSRVQEVQAMLDRMLDLVQEFPEAQFVVAGVDSLSDSIYANARQRGVRVVFNQTYDLLSHAVAAVVTSGTATLETTFFRVPQVVVYRTSFISYHIAKRLIRVPFVSLPNLIADREVVRELLQDDFSVENLRVMLQQLISNPNYRAKVLAGYDEIRARVGMQAASATTARLIFGNSEG